MYFRTGPEFSVSASCQDEKQLQQSDAVSAGQNQGCWTNLCGRVHESCSYQWGVSKSLRCFVITLSVKPAISWHSLIDESAGFFRRLLLVWMFQSNLTSQLHVEQNLIYTQFGVPLCKWNSVQCLDWSLWCLFMKLLNYLQDEYLTFSKMQDSMLSYNMTNS